MLLAATPFPSPLTTPLVTTTYFIFSTPPMPGLVEGWQDQFVCICGMKEELNDQDMPLNIRSAVTVMPLFYLNPLLHRKFRIRQQQLSSIFRTFRKSSSFMHVDCGLRK